MFFIHRYGTKRVLIGTYDPYPFQCPNCKELDTIEFLIYGDYFHYWYVPIFPEEKDGFASCSNCNFTINSVKFNRNTKEIFQQIRKKYRYPFYTYIGIALILTPIIILILALLFSK